LALGLFDPTFRFLVLSSDLIDEGHDVGLVLFPPLRRQPADANDKLRDQPAS